MIYKPLPRFFVFQGHYFLQKKKQTKKVESRIFFAFTHRTIARHWARIRKVGSSMPSVIKCLKCTYILYIFSLVLRLLANNNRLI